MHDMSLGGPVPVGPTPGANHPGQCYDGVYGCHKCHNAANDGEGTICDCEYCGAKDVPTRITMALDEPVMYAMCKKCRFKREKEAQAELEYYRERYDR